MFEFLASPDRAVIDGLEEYERRGRTLRALHGRTDQETLSRWTFTDEQRKAIANGADVFVELSGSSKSMFIRVAVGDPDPDVFRNAYRLRKRKVLK